MEHEPASYSNFVVGEWHVDPASGRVVRGDAVRRLRPQVMDLLVSLARRPGEVVSKAELLDAVWGTRFVSESALTTAIGELRDALEDQAKEPRFIQTVPKRGYRLVAPVTVVDAPPTESSESDQDTLVVEAATIEAATIAPVAIEPAAIEPAAFEAASHEPAAIEPVPIEAARQRRERVWPLMTAFTFITVMALFVGGASWRGRTSAPATPPIEVPISLTPGEEPARTIQMTAMAPDGRTLVYALQSSAGRPLMRRDLATRDVVPIPGTEGAQAPFFSPDGAWIGFWKDGMFRRVPVRGAGADRIEPLVAARETFGASWRENGDLVYSATNLAGLLLLPAGQRTARGLVDLNPANDERSLRWPEALPDSPFVLFAVHRGPTPQVQAIDVTTGARHVVVEGATLARFAAPDRLIYSIDRRLVSAPFNPRTARITGPAIEIARALSFYAGNHLAQFSVSATGVLAYLTETARIDRDLVLVDRAGGVTSLGAPPRPYLHPRLSPDKTRLAVWLEADDAADTADVFTYDLTTKQLTQLTTGGVSWRPAWSPDGRRLAYDARPSNITNVFMLALAPGATPQGLMRRDRPQMAEDWLPDGHWLVMSQVEPDTGRDLHLVNVDTRETRPLANERGDEGGAAVSPNGRWVAYVWGPPNASGVYVVSTEAEHPQRVHLAERGREVRWSRDGHEVFFRDRGAVYSVPISEANGALTPGAPIELFRDDFEERPNPRANYEVMPDGRFLMLRRTDAHPSQAIILSLNWRERRDTSAAVTASR